MANRINIEPLYTCEYCGTYMTYEDIKHTVEIGNAEPKYFCSILCYCEGEPPADTEDYDH